MAGMEFLKTLQIEDILTWGRRKTQTKIPTKTVGVAADRDRRWTLGLRIDMKDYHTSSSSSSPEASKNQFLKVYKVCKLYQKRRQVQFLIAIASAVELSLRLPQVNVLENETFKLHKSKKQRAHKAAKTDLKQKKCASFGLIVFSSVNVKTCERITAN